MKFINYRNVVATFLLILSNVTIFAQTGNRPVIVYVTDAMCAWCYGGNERVSNVQKHFQNKTDFTVISSGFAANENAGTLNTLLPYLIGDYKLVESKTGVTFGEDFLNGLFKDDTTFLDSRNCAVALYIFSLYYPEKSLEFMQCMQHSIFYNGIYPQSKELFDLCALQFDLKPEDLEEKMKQDLNIKSAEAQFIVAEDLNADILPAIYLQMDGEILLVSKGFATEDAIIQTIEKYLKKRKPSQSESADDY
ncbi:MAG: hypothetical protein IPG60_12315 [Bacteroidetes bacterium]|nr:hypothetical protein [Bacteroidota bacterium]MBK7109737.1 hypothetical protein [Bacteroidota bacterium]MBK8487528.1 hypothetical protein [Bacteroidota bacterium]MBK8682727.1 hypothetical protein [Bacteroidota bacterium]MBP9189837.1 hypothetical protein [Chitinophagales bacterium]